MGFSFRSAVGRQKYHSGMHRLQVIGFCSSITICYVQLHELGYGALIEVFEIRHLARLVDAMFTLFQLLKRCIN